MQQSQRSQPSRLVDARAVAETLGVHVATVYRAVVAGSLPAVRCGGRVLFDPAAVAAAVTSIPTQENPR